jgi:branched-chain amino acid transport system substrate-binding protein
VPAASADWAEVARTALASDADTIYFAGPPDASGKLLAALRAAGFKDRFIADSRSESPGFLSAAGQAAEGAYVITPASPENLPQAAAWSKRFAKRFGHEPGRDAMLAYDALRALAQAVTQTGKIDPRLNGAQLPRLDTGAYDGFLGDGLQFAADHTVKYDSNIALTVSGGKFKVESTLRSEDG